MKKENIETISAYLATLKAMQEKVVDMENEEDRNYELLPEIDKEGEPGDRLGFEIDALDNIDYLIGEVIRFIEDNLGDRLPSNAQ